MTFHPSWELAGATVSRQSLTFSPGFDDFRVISPAKNISFVFYLHEDRELPTVVSARISESGITKEGGCMCSPSVLRLIAATAAPSVASVKREFMLWFITFIFD